MEVSKDLGYRFYNVFLYPPDSLSNEVRGPCGTAQIEVFGDKGRLTCHTSIPVEKLSGEGLRYEFPVLFCRELDKEMFNVGYLKTDKSGLGEFAWEFTTAIPGNGGSMNGPVTYRFLVTTRQEGSLDEGRDSVILLEGIVTLASEVRDKRVVGFKKEAKVRKTDRNASETNPLFQKVDPFHPPIPNTSWWRISIQPDLDNGSWQVGYCPRQKPYRAVF